MSDFILGGSKITADGDYSHEIKRCLLLGRKVITAGPFDPEGQGNGGELLDAVEAKLMRGRRKGRENVSKPTLKVIVLDPVGRWKPR